MSLQWFGHRYDAPAWQHIDEVPVPVGEDCIYCRIQFTEDDDGLMVPSLVEPLRFPYHVKCFISSILGPDEALPARINSKEENIAFRKAWDERVEESKCDG